jgi:site-specific DNA-cytosine methylase
MENKIKVVELFAGVGGFRLGLEGWKGKSALSNYKKGLKSPYEVVWSNQWEPSTKSQHASLVYENRLEKMDIATRIFQRLMFQKFQTTICLLAVFLAKTIQ